LLPLAIFLAGGGLLAVSARATFQSPIDVWVMPVVARSDAAPAVEASTASAESRAPASGGLASALCQAPGWVEADPFPITIPALAEGVISEVLFVEGQRVEAGQVVVKMVEEDARLAVDAAAAELAAAQAELERAQAELEYQRVNYDRVLRLHETKNAPDIEWANAKRDHDAAKAQLNASQAKVSHIEVILDQARLTFARMEIKSPVTGVVMARLVEPGTRIAMSTVATGERMGAIARLYDPQHLQVRSDVPLADFAKVGVGTRAEVDTEAVPGAVFHGTVSRLVPEANIQRNTIQVKVAITDPSEALKPEMLARVRFFPRKVQSAPTQARRGTSPGASSMGLLAPRAAMFNVAEDRADVWIVEHTRSGPIAVMRRVKIVGTERDGYCPVADGVQPGMRLIVEPPPGLEQGSRVRVLGERPGPAQP